MKKMNVDVGDVWMLEMDTNKEDEYWWRSQI